MAATRGPVPKRSTERRRRNAESKTEVVKLPAQAATAPDPDPAWHPIASGWYRSLSESGQATFFEPSDWQSARYVAEAITVNLNAGAKFSSMLFAAIWSAMGDLLSTEAARRRVRMEIDREPAVLPAGVTALAGYRKSIGGKK